MATTVNKNVAIFFDDLTEFYAMRKLVDGLLAKKVNLDIIVPFDSGLSGMPESTIKEIKKLGYKPLNDAPKNKVYKVVLTPYPLNALSRTNYIYNLRTPYSVVSAKPNPVYTTLMDYDGIICFNQYEPKILSAYGAECYAVPCWKYYNFKKEKNDKKTLLILPTFGQDTSCLEHLTNELLNELRKHFKVMIKMHHALHFNKDVEETKNRIKENVDEFYTSEIPITDLLKRADIVLSDNSGAIFDSIYSNTPVACFTKDLNTRHFENIDTLQHQLAKKGILPCTDKPDELIKILLSIDKYFKKQQTAKKEIFIEPDKNAVNHLISIINSYLARDEKADYQKTLREYCKKQTKEYLEKINELEIYKQNAEEIFNSKSYRLFTKLKAPVAKINQIRRKNGK